MVKLLMNTHNDLTSIRETHNISGEELVGALAIELVLLEHKILNSTELVACSFGSSIGSQFCGRCCGILEKVAVIRALVMVENAAIVVVKKVLQIVVLNSRRKGANGIV